MLKKNIFTMAILIAGIMLAFSLIGCGDAEGGPIGGLISSGGAFSVKGRIEKAAGEVVSFILARANDSGRSARAAGEVFPMEGKLEDGDITFRLIGTYDPDTGKYTASAASSFIIYTIRRNRRGDTGILAFQKHYRHVAGRKQRA